MFNLTDKFFIFFQTHLDSLLLLAVGHLQVVNLARLIQTLGLPNHLPRFLAEPAVVAQLLLFGASGGREPIFIVPVFS